MDGEKKMRVAVRRFTAPVLLPVCDSPTPSSRASALFAFAVRRILYFRGGPYSFFCFYFYRSHRQREGRGGYRNSRFNFYDNRLRGKS